LPVWAGRAAPILRSVHHTAGFAKANLEQAFLTFVNLGFDTDKLICVLNIKVISSRDITV
jgi:hypothetical protein